MRKYKKAINALDKQNIHIGTLGGHSALDVAFGAKRVGFKTVVVCQKGREKTYSKYYKNLFDEAVIVDSFRELTNKKIINKLNRLNTIFVQSRYFWVYCDHKKIEETFPVPIFGTRGIVKLEERDVPQNQYHLMEKAGIRYPRIYKNPRQIDRLVLVKASESHRKYERAFFFANDYKDYVAKADKWVKEGLIAKEKLKEAVIEEYIIGAQVNFNFFYSPMKKRLELLGTDTRRQTNLDGLIRIPAEEQLKIANYLKPQYIETGHIAVTVKESILEKAFELGRKLVRVVKKDFPPGIIGPFALQSVVVAGPPKEDIVTFDLSLRIPGSPGTSFTPYTRYLFGEPLMVGERVALEIKEALRKDKLDEILT